MGAKWFGRAILGATLFAVFGIVGLVQPAGGAGEPVAQPPPAPQNLNTVLAAPHEEGEEVPELRSRFVKTYAAGHGTFRAEVSDQSVNYRDPNGAWQPVDNSIVTATGTGYAFQNKANRFAVDLPMSLGTQPVRVHAGKEWLTFRPQGAEALASVNDNTATYADAVPGVTATYRVMGDGLKEDLVFAGPSSPATVSFAVGASPGISARMTEAGGLEFVDAGGELAFRFEPPSMRDGAGASSDAVALNLRSSEVGWTVDVVASQGWLSAPDRVWPVAVDPTVFVGPSLTTTQYPGIDCAIKSTSSSSDCSSTTFKVGYDGTTVYRALIRFNEAAIPLGVQVLYGKLKMTLDTTVSTTTEIDAHRVSSDHLWSPPSGSTTWTSADGTNNWASAGGDFVSASYDQVSTHGSAGSVVYFEITEPLQEWVDGDKQKSTDDKPNQGLLLKTVNEGQNKTVTFRTSEYGGSEPLLTVTYKPRTGQLRQYTFGDTVNLANGNVFVGASDLSAPGVGLGLSIDRYYNRLDTGSSGAFGPGWTMSPGRDAGLEIYGGLGEDGSAAFYGPSGYAVPFAKRRDGTFRNTLTGVDGRLTYNSGTSEYTVRFNYTGEKYVFDSGGILTKRMDDNGNTISYTYTSGKLTSITDTFGHTVTISYGGNNFVSSISDWSSPARTWTYTYWTTTNLLKTVTDPESNVTSYEYDTAKNLTKITDSEGNQKRFSYTAGSYDTIAVKYVTDNTTGAGYTWTYEFCGTVVSCPAAGADGLTKRTVLTDPNSHATHFVYDEGGRVKDVTNANGNSSSLVLGPNSRINSRTNTRSATTTYDYDDLTTGDQKLKQVTLPTGAISTLDYTNTSRPFDVTDVSDGNGHSMRYGYDNSTGDLTSMKYAPGTADEQTASYSYNSKGLPTQSTDFKGNVTSFENDPSGIYGPAGAHLTKIDHPSPLGDETFTYDAAGRLASATDGKGQKTEYAYDKLNRATQLTFRKADTTVESTTSYVYDGNGNVTSVTDATGTTSYDYDKLRRLIEETLPTSVVTDWTYDGVNLVSMTRASDTTSYGYDGGNRVTSITEPGSSVISITYDDADGMTRTTFPAGSSLVSTCAYVDGSDRISGTYTISGTTCASTLSGHSASGSDIAYFKYSYAGSVDTSQRTSVTDKNSAKTAYTYDFLGRLIQAVNKDASNAQQWATQYAYDANSNRCAARTLTTTAPSTLNCSTSPDSVTTKYTVNAVDELTAITTGSGTTTNTYDSNGNLSTGSVWTYNAQDQAKSYQPTGSAPISMTYRGGGQFDRATAGGTTFTGDALGLGQEITGSTTTKYTRTPGGTILGFNRGGTRYYYAVDGQGSVCAVVKDDGSTVATYDYDPFGQLRTSTGSLTNPYRWLGSLGVYADDATTGVYKMGTRWYDPSVGRFTQTDPVPGGSLTAFDYASQDPVNNVDPSGQFNGCGPGGSTTSNILTKWLINPIGFDLNIIDACAAHDDCYGTWKHFKTTCDLDFLEAVHRKCNRFSLLFVGAVPGSACYTFLTLATFAFASKLATNAYVSSQLDACPFKSRKKCLSVILIRLYEDYDF